jgi:hypothetical protein
VRDEAGSGTLGFLATALASAVSAGLTVITGTVLLADALRSSDPASNLDLRLYLLFGGTLSGILLAAFAAWRMLGSIASTYRRGGLAMVCAFATVVVMLICVPINQYFGRTGLIVLLGSCGVMAILLARRTARIRARP